MPPVHAVLFDAYGTLFDVYSVALLAEQLYPGRGETLARLWRDKQIEYSRLVSMADPAGRRYRPFWDLTRAGLRQACALLGLELPPAHEERLMNQYRHLSAFPENHEVLAQIRALGLPTGILSNGDPAMLEVAVKSAGLQGLLDEVISVEPVRCFKPDPRVYQLGLDAVRRRRPDASAKQVLFVSSNGWDAIGATWFGFTTFWLNRAGLPAEPLGTRPTHEGRSLHELLPLLRGGTGGAA
ncbi:haloacid dehalogenase type II [Caldimonas thermodepolymerans]|jgi:2-haloalkanoic acid dehalogenase, type II|uniref:(S)-2-haloacid dehalogenase n=1 Tax=Caldimonas thermodepolymerans TaxID=215580 RepID=A0A2S5T589_9BURK|nr:haloacid dehalogenase type II [Caldimonas thermodepolymerans]PPE70116.1 haloacid dehalogenase type II [Caldimonas thermodepolymerans]QPC33274.1 haloacid dehalogenase type II [Caldimonas thermodepolymerans]RDI01766.1 2-haloacid dehalogenase [Caldimonas thermodepolymerans]TCP05903.1 2-haloacid dehalogenase [Caldimonas thermodepolymerans]UZG50018.1 haloacid dehalogenase type II [Caldimonas thermodepolymerans]